ncbi:hypothetical protein ACEWBT_24410 [Vibrio parahaemolyticus]|uniref:hypothetical protein n=1 Tax=Gammaproteobacteria TaxID=1236 RepID=UPI000761A57D|nr:MULTISPECIES: hypothetical protein [Gammaproteobacteria]MCZ5987221.1 hypothetical protein [Vibrio parahaemolyticus]MCZ6288889.1 hypothetical protein [Vibrio parahaemolyticus]MCZ6372361.1 hypothetical protein [Vibrio parahaemolyticus]MDF4423040.1 hypothetical protein [Vibrio parahaemolyticus]MDF4620860.1 hypothetical protein [Vibrio parahaemolyticus]
MLWMFKSPIPGGLAENLIKNKEKLDIDCDGRVTLRMESEEALRPIQAQIRLLRKIKLTKRKPA